ncbi:uncharacterized protein LOC123229221 isoform X2 [Mangifera indica]|uniref:uncharacterized protein LOC123229221 isoform X2 n=1 Tax=Mangifera indica TaxID=29780 RepID=UPI001CFA883D|nr:uncharacterized protein LOC123229221 isoform X2 [Mangifera indica]
MAQYRPLGHHSNNSNGTSSADHVSIGIRNTTSHGKLSRPRRSARLDKAGCSLSVASVSVFLSLVLLVTLLAYFYISGYNTLVHTDNKDTNSYHTMDGDLMNELDFLTNVTRRDTFKVLGFGKGSVSHGRDSRYWDKDDRRRDDDYNEDEVERSSMAARGGSNNIGHVPVKVDNGNQKISSDDQEKVSEGIGVGLYNEAGRDELRMYEAEYEASLKNLGQSGKTKGNGNQQYEDKDFMMQSEATDVDDDYDSNAEFHDSQVENNDFGHNKGNHSDLAKIHDQDHMDSSDFRDIGMLDQDFPKEVDETSNKSLADSSIKSTNLGNSDTHHREVSITGGKSTGNSRSESKRKKRRKFSGTCEMKFLNSTAQLVEPLESRKFARFFVQYTEVEEKPDGVTEWEPRFAGHQSLQDQEKSFLAHDQKINCGFVKGPKGSPSTGFDLSEDDANYISKCHIAVVSCIFGNSDRLRVPAGKTVTRLSRKNVCFVMFMDALTLQTLISEGLIPDRTGFIGLWRIVVVQNLPYTDMRRVGKIPKLLSHRLFPSARYSIWLDSKLRLQLDPLLILEYFLWRKGHEYAISNHYDRHCVWEEVAQNKKLNKYNHTVIDQQFAFYQDDGLKRFNASDPNKLLPSNVPEGSFIVRAHTPMSNLFSCLWFNEVDRFTPRDQLSFAYTYQKLRRTNPGKMFYLNMFKDCERRAIAKLFHHRGEEKQATHQHATM